MDLYLINKFKGTYRVLAELDEKTNDFVRDDKGNIDESFSDFYIKCQGGIKIKHGVGSILSTYIPSKTKGVNILRKIWSDNTNDSPLPKESQYTITVGKRHINTCYYDNLCEALMDKGILDDVEVLDSEVIFEFNVKDIEYYAKLLKASTSGAKISPFSKKNLPKEKYIIPKSDINDYNDAIRNFPRRNMGTRTMVDGLFIKRCNTDFMAKNHIKNNTSLKDKELIHKKGKWDKYIKYLKGVKV